jgi:hypothetical protein
MTIDHTAETLAYLDVAANTHDLQLKQIALTNAQVHATLAVDKQALIANLIAVADADRDFFSTEQGESKYGTLFAAIREGLGI